MKTAGVSVHRFHDQAAISATTEGPTFYLTSAAAKALGKHLLKLAKDIDTVKFTNSQIYTVEINDSGLVVKQAS